MGSFNSDYVLTLRDSLELTSLPEDSEDSSELPIPSRSVRDNSSVSNNTSTAANSITCITTSRSEKIAEADEKKAFKVKRMVGAGESQEESFASSTTIGGESREAHGDTDITDATEYLELKSKYLETLGPVKLPGVILNEGLPLLKVSHRTRKRIQLRLELSSFTFKWTNRLNSASMPIPTKLTRLLESATPGTSKNKIHEFSVGDLRSVIPQEEATNYREELHVSKEFEPQWLTVIFLNRKKNKLKSLHLIADSVHEWKKLYATFQSVTNLRHHLATNFFIDLNEMDQDQRKIIFQSNNGNGKQTREYLTFQDVLKYLKRLHVNMNDNYLKENFDLIADSHEESKRLRSLNFEQFKKYVSVLKRRDDINDLWSSLCGKGKSMTFPMFKSFMIKIQKENHSDSHLRKLFLKFCVDNKDYWYPENFNNFLLSKASLPLIDFGEDERYFSYPLNEYYISSSHNTYLMGRQFVGDSSVEGYIKALQRGCRCIEVDIWDGVEDSGGKSSVGEPVVCHGRSFTSSISFENVVRTIKKYAFNSTPMPLIISLEIHCSREQQLKIRSILINVLGDALISSPLNGESILPSPVQLKYKILIKVKKTSPFQSYLNDNGQFPSSYTSTSTTSATSFSEDNYPVPLKSRNLNVSSHPGTTKILDELSRLGVYTQGLKFRNFSLPESKMFNHCFSLGEKSLNRMLKDDVKRLSLDKHNRKYLMRVYPSKFRIKSSNFIPIQFWDIGIQMVATNWQTYDLGQQLNESLFHGSGDRGFILKSENLRKPPLKSSKKTFLTTDYKSDSFNIQIISAHQMPSPKGMQQVINPFVTLEVIGATKIEWASNDTKSSTKIVSANGFNPIWNHTFSCKFEAANDLVFLRFLINSSSSSTEEVEVNTIGIEVVQLSQLKQGYRYLPINDPSGEELIYSSIFVKVDHSMT